MERTTVTEPMRLDHLVTTLPSVGSRSRTRRVLEAGKVTVDGEDVGIADASRMLQPGQVVTLRMDRPGTAKQHSKARRGMRQRGLDILFEDEAMVAINKPPGLLSDTASRRQQSRGSARALVDTWLRGMGQRGHVVHRIDRDTSGVILFARTEAARDHLKAQFAERSAQRTYWAAVEGRINTSPGRVGHWMWWDPKANRQTEADPSTAGAFFAEADYTVDHAGPRGTILTVQLVSGRRNQIRLQCALMGHPLIGEVQYRDEPPGSGVPRATRQCLHATELTIVSPHSGQPTTIRAPLPNDLVRVDKSVRGTRRS